MKKVYALVAVLVATLAATAGTVFASITGTGRCPFCLFKWSTARPAPKPLRAGLATVSARFASARPVLLINRTGSAAKS